MEIRQMPTQGWYGVSPMVACKWTCGYCGLTVGDDKGFYKDPGKITRQEHDALRAGVHVGHVLIMPPLPANEITADLARIMICPHCEKPTFFDGGKQVPGVTYGKPVMHLPSDLDEIYTEARNCLAVNAFIPAVLTARTILMHIAVEQGAAEGLTFLAYVDHLVNKNLFPPNAQKWIDHVRVKGNAATHKINLMTRDDAEKVLRFVEMILLFLYEYPNVA